MATRNSELVHASDPGTEVRRGEIWGEGAAEKTYEVNQFNPATEDVKFSYTPGRIAKNLFNTYSETKQRVFAYYTDWSQYDSRYGQMPGDTNVDYKEGGRGTDVLRLNRAPAPFDKLIIGFAGIIGDQGEKRDTINRAALDFRIASSQADLPNQRGKATFTDGWGDVLSYINCGFEGWFSDDVAGNFTQNKAHGVLGALAKLKRTDPKLNISLSLGGWTMSEAFHSIAKEKALRTRLVESLSLIVHAFPMFTELDLDWEYPGAEGAPGNNFGPEDPENFALLIEELKKNPILSNVKVSIAVAGTVEKLKASNIPRLLNAGVSGLNLMAYDFFGTPWAEKLAHHTNLKGPSGSTPSADSAVQYLIGTLDVPPASICLGYAGYTRNAQRAQVTQVSGLKGEYEPYPGETTVGSFESGTSEWPDILKNYLDLENKKGLNGFELYTDTASDADFLYNKKSQVFISLDTPRTVKAKAEYVAKHGLGGLFVWTGDADNGLLTNAAREGLGAKPTGAPAIDMKDFYFTGKTGL